MAEMNVVPYIDVTLVLLIIFMITAPLITQGVKVDLPQAPSQVVEPSNKEPVIVSVNEAGEVFIDFGDNPDKAVDEETLVTRIAAVNKYQPGTQFLVKGDRGASYGRVVQVMALMQSAGIETVGLLTEPPDKAR
ncbi:MAG: protein TolR [Gammaproteobacteria bacterium]|nr:protein TolR [Gammaproteobacteria bacterium]MBI5617149.1 protein TolR [Gammaproteobacteria bacterium]